MGFLKNIVADTRSALPIGQGQPVVMPAKPSYTLQDFVSFNTPSHPQTQQTSFMPESDMTTSMASNKVGIEPAMEETMFASSIGLSETKNDDIGYETSENPTQSWGSDTLKSPNNSYPIEVDESTGTSISNTEQYSNQLSNEIQSNLSSESPHRRVQSHEHPIITTVSKSETIAVEVADDHESSGSPNYGPANSRDVQPQDNLAGLTNYEINRIETGNTVPDRTFQITSHQPHQNERLSPVTRSSISTAPDGDHQFTSTGHNANIDGNNSANAHALNGINPILSTQHHAQETTSIPPSTTQVNKNNSHVTEQLNRNNVHTVEPDSDTAVTHYRSTDKRSSKPHIESAPDNDFSTHGTFNADDTLGQRVNRQNTFRQQSNKNNNQPRVVIGQVNVTVDLPAPQPVKSTVSDMRNDFSSRHYLRRLR